MRSTATARVLSPIIVGRDDELAALTAAVGRTVSEGRGAAVVLGGEPGVGKTRLARAVVEHARAEGVTTLVGRSVQQGSSAYRPIAEALFPIARREPVLDDPQLRTVRASLGRIVPDWRDDDAAVDESAVVVGEALLRLLRHLAGGSAALLVLEDLHWADPETLAVFEYLADNVADERVVLLATARTGGSPAAGEVIHGLRVRNAVEVVTLDRLAGDDIEAMVRACAGDDVPEAVVATVAERSEGLPLLVEELLSAGAAASSDAIPTSFADSVGRRVAGLPAEAVLVLQCASVLGRRFDWELLPVLAGVPDAAVVAGLEHGVAAQLIDVEPGGRFRFHHALTRDVVLDSLLPPTRVALAARAARAVEAASGGSDEDLVLAADLWELSGDGRRATSCLVAAGRRAIDAGALATAEALLRRAHDLARRAAPSRTVEDPGPTGVADTAEALAEALAPAAKVDEAVRLGELALQELARTSGTEGRRAALHLVLARAAVAATRWSLARGHLDHATELAAAAGDEALQVRVRSLAAHLAMGELRLEAAVELARTASEAAERLHLPEVRCEALEIIGRRERLRDLGAAEAAFAAAYETARANRLQLAAVRALHELGTIDMFRTSSPGRLIDARDLAVSSGAVSIAATVELQLLGLLSFRFELAEAQELGERLAETTGRLGAPDLHASVLLQLGFVYALLQRRDAMETTVQRALAVAGDHPEANAMAWGHARATASLFSEDLDRARDELARAVEHARRTPGVPGAFVALWGLLRVLDDNDTGALAEARQIDAQATPLNDAILGYADAVVGWRSGEAEAARRRFGASDEALQAKVVPGVFHLARRLVGERALAEGWGDGAQWLREAMDFFQGTGHDRIASACAATLRDAGERVPRSRSDAVPADLRRRGVTGRELEVLVLVGGRLTNRQIAERLFLSPRTVEKHVERLLQKLGARSRAELVALAPDVRERGEEDT